MSWRKVGAENLGVPFGGVGQALRGLGCREVRLLKALGAGFLAAVIVSVLAALLDVSSGSRGAVSLIAFGLVAWLVNINLKEPDQEDGVDPDLRRPAPDGSVDIGAGLWQRVDGWEAVRVWHNETTDRFYFSTSDHFTYGSNVGGYGRRELATLYMGEKLSLSPERLAAVDPSAEPAVILNQFGQPVLAASDWEEGLDPLLADPAFHAQEGG